MNINIVLLATAWGPRFGGINAFNRDFAVGLATVLRGRGKVFCAVPNAEKEDVEDAARIGVTLLPLPGKELSKFDNAWSFEIANLLKEKHGVPEVSWWVGHDVIMGAAALYGPKAGGGKTALIMHMSYVDYLGVKHRNAGYADVKYQLQKTLFTNGGARLFAVGPLLKDACHNLSGHKPVMLVPGFPTIPNRRPPATTLVALTFGRLDRDEDRIKQGRLAILSFAEAIKNEHEKNEYSALAKGQMCLIGLNDQLSREESELRELANKRAQRAINVYPLPYDADRERLWERLGGASLALMLSWHEGFGLTGWEAIAAELPLIIGRNSGLFKLIRESLGDTGSDCVFDVDIRGQLTADDTSNENDIREVSLAISTIADKLDLYQKKAKRLKQLLRRRWRCTWEETAIQFLKGLGLAVKTTSSGYSINFPQAPIILASGQSDSAVQYRDHSEPSRADVDASTAMPGFSETPAEFGSGPTNAFLNLFRYHWDVGSGLPRRSETKSVSWTREAFLGAMAKVQADITANILANWLTGVNVPVPTMKDSLRRVLFPNLSRGLGDAQEEREWRELRDACDIAWYARGDLGNRLRRQTEMPGTDGEQPK